MRLDLQLGLHGNSHYQGTANASSALNTGTPFAFPQSFFKTPLIPKRQLGGFRSSLRVYFLSPSLFSVRIQGTHYARNVRSLRHIQGPVFFLFWLSVCYYMGENISLGGFTIIKFFFVLLAPINPDALPQVGSGSAFLTPVPTRPFTRGNAVFLS
ncbi:hypothetical protein B0H19DRAFT_1196141 [Mycena capillaripes]|nr:hypothetical protein B0H19DRAFT_1196141 [Mycena capillaripes]